ncbi:hypothetical protein EMIT0P395_230069 [Pseudomonas sp. IT-P395]
MRGAQNPFKTGLNDRSEADGLANPVYPKVRLKEKFHADEPEQRHPAVHVPVRTPRQFRSAFS